MESELDKLREKIIKISVSEDDIETKFQLLSDCIIEIIDHINYAEESDAERKRRSDGDY